MLNAAHYSRRGLMVLLHLLLTDKSRKAALKNVVHGVKFKAIGHRPDRYQTRRDLLAAFGGDRSGQVIFQRGIGHQSARAAQRLPL